DGPSAGIAIATAIVSAITKKPINKDVAMTGEITLRGRALPIGGLKEKSLAALRADIKTIIIPEKNKKDLDEIPKIVKNKIKYVFAKHVEDVLKVALLDDDIKEKKPKKENKPGKQAKPSKQSDKIRKSKKRSTEIIEAIR
ncbi:S16 family serine protease, partial [Thermodesulfobacteriota bacterium]